MSVGGREGTPGSLLAIRRIPNSISDFDILIRVGGVDLDYPVGTLEPEGGRAGHSILVPIHPDGVHAHGPVEFVLTSADVSCPLGTFEILPLRAARDPLSRGAARRYLDASAATLEATLNAAGFTWTDLEGGSTLPSELLATVVEYALLHDPNEANSLRSVLDAAERAGNQASIDGLDIVMREVERVTEAHAFEVAPEEVMGAQSAGIFRCLDLQITTSADVRGCIAQQRSAKVGADVLELIGDLTAVLSVYAIFSPVPGDEAILTGSATIALAAQVTASIRTKQLPSSVSGFRFAITQSTLDENTRWGRFHSVEVRLADSEAIDVTSETSTVIAAALSRKVRFTGRWGDQLKEVMEELLGGFVGHLVDKVVEKIGVRTFEPIRYSGLGWINIEDAPRTYTSRIDKYGGPNLVRVTSHSTGSYYAMILEDGTSRLYLQLAAGAYGEFGLEYELPIEVIGEDDCTC